VGRDPDSPADDPRPHWLEPVVTLLLGTGMRAGEACALDWRDVDLDAGTVLIRSGKTRSATRTVPLPPFVIRALTRHRATTPRYGPREPVFLSPRRSRSTRAVERLRVDTLTHAFPRLLERHGIERLHVHGLRHGTATLLLARGVPMRVIADILGHSNPALTARLYAHVGEDSRRAAIAVLEDVSGSG
jgi:integrase